MSPIDEGDRDGAVPPPAPPRARRSRKSANARLHPVGDPDAWRNAVLPDPAAADTDQPDEGREST